MGILTLLQLSALATLALAQTSYVETFSSAASDTQPAPIPGVDRALQWTGIKPVKADDIGTGSGVKPDGTYYGAFDASTPLVISTQYSGSKVGHFTPSTYKLGCAVFANNKYTPTGSCSIKLEARNETGVVGTDYQTYPTPRACYNNGGPLLTDCPLYNFGFYPPNYTNLQTLTYTVQPPTQPVNGKIVVYLDDFTYTAK